ncbi:MAG: 4Fe-4S dicluster domain-containing protein [Chloroflexi bacterium]|nr:4Fe-4S dicluster domain-containing protein [Chloroflexota bacterium]
MQKTILVDAQKCTGCRTCELVCSVKNEGMANPSRARLTVVKFEDILLEIPMLCQQCSTAPCMAICPAKAISRDDASGIVSVNYDLCIGCKMCVVVCPFGAMKFDPVSRKVAKCEQCGGDPTCVKFCETKALQYVDVAAVNLKKAREGARRLSEIIQKTAREPVAAEQGSNRNQG